MNDTVENENTEIDSSKSALLITETKWFHEDSCTACSVGLNSRMRELLDTGMSQRKAAEIMSEEAKGEISADTIRRRYRYYNDNPKGKKVEQTSHPNKDSVQECEHAGGTSHPEELCKPSSSGNLCIPLETHQNELITAMADFFMDKKIHQGTVEDTLKGVIALIDRRMCCNVDPRLTWIEFQDEQERKGLI